MQEQRSSLQEPKEIEGAQKGAKHKHKEKEKGDKKGDKNDKDHGSGDHEKGDAGKGKSESKSKKKKNKEENKGAEGIKRPLSAYMLYNNHRRPVLRKEHPCKLILT